MKKKLALMVMVMLAGVLLGAVLVSAQQPPQEPQGPGQQQPRQPHPDRKSVV